MTSISSATSATAPPPLLDLRGLSVELPAGSGDGWLPILRDVSFVVRPGEMVGLVGESGSGKSLTALSVLRLLPRTARVSGSVRLDGEELLGLPESAMRRVRGARIGLVFQEPATALNPVYTIGFQVAEAITAHHRLGRREARDRAIHLLERVALPDARRRLSSYPHQLSGGQRQRVMLAIALAQSPDLLLADEPTTALDVTLQAQILQLLERLRRDLGLAVLLITHDLAVVAERCDRVVVMYAGQVVEEATTEALFAAPAHPYTRGLLATLPRLGTPVRNGRLPVLAGRPPAPGERPAGCAFAPRCPEVMEVCRRREPPLAAVGGGAGGTFQSQDPSRARCFLVGGAAGEAA